MNVVDNNLDALEYSVDNVNMIDVEGIGSPIFIDRLNQLKFYIAYRTCRLKVSLGDCVRINLEIDDDELSTKNEDSVTAGDGYGQILSIFEDNNSEMFIEVRWFLEKNEMNPSNLKKLDLKDNELIESDNLDDIPAGSVAEVIEIRDYSGRQSQSNTFIGHYICRYMETSGTKAIQKISHHSMRQRGMKLSHYGYAYSDYFENEVTDLNTDPYSIAIRNLHISVIPTNLPCRSEERNMLQDYLRRCISTRDFQKPIYISGMPGTGKTATVTATVKALKVEAENGQLAPFQFIDINCLMLKQPTDAYSVLWRSLTGIIS